MTTKRTIRVLVVSVGKNPEVREVPREGFDRGIEGLVGGAFEAHPLEDETEGGGLSAYVNEMGMAIGLPQTCWVSGQFLHGTVVLVRIDPAGKPVDLTDTDIKLETLLFGREFQAWNLGVVFEGDGPRARVLLVSPEHGPRLAWLPIEGGGRITTGLQTLLDGVYDAYPLQEDANGGGLDAHVNMLAKESGQPKHLEVDGRWLHGTIVVARRRPQIGYVDLTDADIEACAERFGIDLSALAHRDRSEVQVMPGTPAGL